MSRARGPTLIALRERLRSSLWFIPGLFAVGAVVAAQLVVMVDRALAADASLPIEFGGTAEGARSILSTIAQSMLAFTGLVFTVTMLVLQLASSQLSPRVMRTFLRDRGNQVVLGLFVATLLYALMVLREIRTDVDGVPGFVPGLAVWGGFVLLLASIAAFVWYIDHMAHAIRATTVMDNIRNETEEAMDRCFPDPVDDDEAPDEAESPDRWRDPVETVPAPRSGEVVAVRDADLLETTTGDRRVEVVPGVGSFIAEGALMLRLWGSWDDGSRSRAADVVDLGPERTMEMDPAFGLRQLVDIALRALSPGINDPTTAIQSLDRIHDLMRRLATRAIPSPVRRDDAGAARLLLHEPGWEAYVDLATRQIHGAATAHPVVLQRLLDLLDDVALAAPDVRRPPLWAARSRVEMTLARTPEG